MKNAEGDLKWKNIDKGIKRVFMTSCIKGIQQAKEIVKAISTNDKSKVVKYLRDYKPGNGTSRDTLRIRYLNK